MDFSFDEMQQAARDLSRQILKDKVDESALQAAEKGPWHCSQAHQALAEAGLLEALVDDPISAVLILSEAGWAVAPLPLVEIFVAGGVLRAFGADDRVREVTSGLSVVTLALNPGAHHDRNVPTCTFDGHTITGQVPLVTCMETAQYLLVSARAPDGPVLGLVETANCDTEKQLSTTGQPLYAVTLDAVSALAVYPSDALSLALKRMELGLCALAHGVARRALDLTARYARERTQFERPIGSFQAVSQRAANGYIDLQAMELTLWESAWYQAAQRDGSAARAVARYWACEGVHRITAAAQHLHGGMGFDKDYPLYRTYLWSKHLELQLGGANAQLSRIGAVLD